MPWPRDVPAVERDAGLVDLEGADDVAAELLAGQVLGAGRHPRELPPPLGQQVPLDALRDLQLPLHAPVHALEVRGALGHAALELAAVALGRLEQPGVGPPQGGHDVRGGVHRQPRLACRERGDPLARDQGGAHGRDRAHRAGVDARAEHQRRWRRGSRPGRTARSRGPRPRGSAASPRARRPARGGHPRRDRPGSTAFRRDRTRAARRPGRPARSAGHRGPRRACCRRSVGNPSRCRGQLGPARRGVKLANGCRRRTAAAAPQVDRRPAACVSSLHGRRAGVRCPPRRRGVRHGREPREVRALGRLRGPLRADPGRGGNLRHPRAARARDARGRREARRRHRGARLRGLPGGATRSKAG